MDAIKSFNMWMGVGGVKESRSSLVPEVGVLGCWESGVPASSPSSDTSYCSVFLPSAHHMSCSGFLGLLVSQYWEYEIKFEMDTCRKCDWQKTAVRLGWALVEGGDLQFHVSLVGMWSRRTHQGAEWGGVGGHPLNVSQIFSQKRGWERSLDEGRSFSAVIFPPPIFPPEVSAFLKLPLLSRCSSTGIAGLSSCLEISFLFRPWKEPASFSLKVTP